ncbi:MAG: hypothetical protein A2X46_00345 [Lentisphaerae bacterium GWF2_57_35]|nr:MAG: hypothetical protein A2X46_00345 [Lentisphaerae bacterium GWF2_57_35]
MMVGVAAGVLLIAVMAQASQNAAAARLPPGQGTVVQTISFQLQDVTIVHEANFDRIELKDGEIPEDLPGAPALPVRYINILLPAGADVIDVQVTPTQEQLAAENVVPYPIQPPAPRSEAAVVFAEANAQIYGQTALYPSWSGQGDKAQKIRGFSMAPVRLNPLRYAPAEKKLYLAEALTVTVSYRQEALLQKRISAPIPHAFKSQVQLLVVNPDQPGAEPVVSEENVPSELTSGGLCDYLVITKASLTNAFAALTQHRSAYNGFHCEILSVEWIDAHYDGTRPSGGSDIQTKIRQCISDYVHNQGTEFVVLGGDNTIVADRDCAVSSGSYSSSNMPTDLYYAGLDGNWDDFDADGVYGEANVGSSLNDEGDLSADVFVGRIPIRTAQQAADYINKVISYETTPPYQLVKNFAMGGVLLWNSYTNTQRPTDAMNDGHLPFQAANHPKVTDAEMWARRTFRDSVQAYNWQAAKIGCLFDTLTSWDSATGGDYPASYANLKTHFNDGWNFLIFDTHGGNSTWSAEGGSFNATHALSMTGLCVTVYTMACNSGGFDVADPSLSEGFLRCANGGALLYFGCSRYGWGSPDAPPADSYSTGGTSSSFMRKFLQLIFQSHYLNSGDVFYRHKAAFVSQSGANGSYRWVQFGLNFQGDPALSFVVDKPTVGVAAENSPISESSATPAVLRFFRDHTEGAMTIRYSLTGNASPSTNFSCTPGLSQQGSVIIPSGSNALCILMHPIDNNVPESVKELTLALETDGGYTIGDSCFASILLEEDDADQDGLPDDWEHYYELDVGAPSADQDSDGDHYSDYEEYIAGTSPVDTSSSFSSGDCVYDGSTTAVTFPTQAGRLYTIEWNDSLNAAAWQILLHNLVGTGSPVIVPDTPNGEHRFYRIKVQLDY